MIHTRYSEFTHLSQQQILEVHNPQPSQLRLSPEFSLVRHFKLIKS